MRFLTLARAGFRTRRLPAPFLALGVAVSIGSTLASLASAADASVRSLRVADRYAREELHDMGFSPDGKIAAFVRRRAATSQATNGLLIPQTRDDIWIHEAGGQPVRNLTDGQRDQSGSWSPKWSPDTNRMAFLSTRGGSVCLWTWDRRANSFRKFADLPVAFDHDDTYDYEFNRAFRWIDDRRILVVCLPTGTTAPYGKGPSKYIGQAIDRIESAWARAKRSEVTASVVDSLQFNAEARKLLLLDVESGEAQFLGFIQAQGFFDSRAAYWLAPDNSAVLLLHPTPAQYPSLQHQALGFPGEVEVRRLDGQLAPLRGPLPKNIVTTSIQWSRDGREIAFFALGDKFVHPELLYRDAVKEVRYPPVGSKEYPGKLYRLIVATGELQEVNTGDLDLGQSTVPPGFQRGSSGEFLFHTTLISERASLSGAARARWRVLDPSGRIRDLAAGNHTAPRSLRPVEAGAAFVGIVDGDVWRVRVADGKIDNLTAKFDRPIVAFASDLELGEGLLAVICRPLSGNAPSRIGYTLAPIWWKLPAYPNGDCFQLAVSTGQCTALPTIKEDAWLCAISSTSKNALFFTQNNRGTFLWRMDAGNTAQAIKLQAVNGFFASIRRPAAKLIEYTGANGETLVAKLTLPVGFEPGRRYPLVVDSDIGSVPATRVGSGEFTISVPEDGFRPLDPPGDPMIYSAAGYAYLFVSMPTTGMDEVGRNNLLQFTDGLIPAVQKVIDDGYADPDRLLLYGMSSMSYGVYGIITQTARFRAAVTEFGWCDWTSWNLTTDLRRRYTSNPFDRTRFAPYHNNINQPFWRNGDFLRRNSPLSYVDRVQTPLMIVDSDFDVGGLENVEMFFSGLVQQRKPARFVRYWGEAHGTQTPANTADRLQRIFSWYDQWADIARDDKGAMIFEGNQVKSRKGAPALQPEDYAKFEIFGPGGDAK